MTKLEQMQEREDAIEKVMDVVLDPDAAPAHIRKALDSLITEVWNEAIKECEGIVEQYLCQTPHCQNGHYPLGMHEDGEMEWGGCPNCVDGNGRLPQYTQAEEIMGKLDQHLPRADITSDK